MQLALKNLVRITKLFPQKTLFILVILLTVFLGVFEIAISYSFKSLMDSVLSGQFSDFLNTIYLLGGIVIANTVFMYLRNRGAGSYAEGGIKLLRKLLTQQTIYLPFKEVETRHSGEMLSRLTNDMNLVQTFTAQTLIALFFNLLTAVGAFIVVMILHWKLAVICTIGIPLVISLSSFASGPVAKYTRKLQEELAVMNSYTQDTVSGVEVMRAFNLEEVLSEKYEKSIFRVKLFGYKVAAARSVLGFINSITGIAPFLISFGFGGYFVIRGEMTPGALIAFINLLNPLAFPVAQMPVLIGDLRAQMEGAKRIFEIIDLPLERNDGQSLPIQSQKSVLTFDNVTFKYVEDGEVVLNRFNFDVRAGEKVALVGSSGSGKTTIIKLLLGYYDNYEGEIKIFGQELKKWDLKELRNYLSLVSQETYLFPVSIEENIAYGKDGADSGEVILAAKAAQAHDFITRLKEGYLSSVGEYGDRLSGGEKQRISIARAILKQAPVLLLDEATSSLDRHAEHLVQNAIDNVIQEGTTALIIAHRLSTIQKADRILVIDQGRVVESGKHEELLGREGLYKKLYLRQLAANEEQLEKEAVV